jgi:hypothetical protein
MSPTTDPAIDPQADADQLDPSERTPCEIWSRVMGYHRPVSAYNVGKQAEHAERRYFREAPPAQDGTA